MKPLAARTLVLALAAALAAPAAAAFDLGRALEGALLQGLGLAAPAPTAPAAPAAPAAPDKLGLVLGIVQSVSPEQEQAIGRQIAGNLLGAVALARNDALQRYVASVGLWVARHSSRPDLPWRFGVLEHDTINAFAAPGGYIFITTGLYRMLGSEAELAGVLGHEIAHVTQQHHMRLLRQSQVVALAGLGVARQVQATHNPALQNIIGNGAEMMARGLDRDAELDADRIGLIYATRAGYSPWGLPVALQRMAALPEAAAGASLFLSTHPPASDRLAALAAAVGEQLDAVPGLEPPLRVSLSAAPAAPAVRR